MIIISYHKLRGWADSLAGTVKLVVFDECQQLRSGGTMIHAACSHVARSTPLRLGLSATPIYNYGDEFWSVLDALLPDALGSRDEFLREWCTTTYGQNHRLNDSEQFGAYVRREGFMLRRTRRDVARELPSLTKVPHTIGADASKLKDLGGDAVKLARLILESGPEQQRGERMRAAGEFDIIMRQATGLAKAPFVAEFVSLLVQSGETVVLFGWHRAVYDIWLERLKEHNPVLYTGTESPAQKDAALQALRSGESKVLIMSLRSGAGVDGLQDCCRTVVFGELDWSPGVHEQCTGRVHRDGQADPVVAYFLVSEEGSDPIVSDVLGVKREQVEGVRNPDTALSERIDAADGHIRRLAQQFLEGR